MHPKTVAPLIFTSLAVNGHVLATNVECLASTSRTEQHGDVTETDLIPFSHKVLMTLPAAIHCFTLRMDEATFNTCLPPLHACLVAREKVQWEIVSPTLATPFSFAGYLQGLCPGSSVYGPVIDLEIFVPPA